MLNLHICKHPMGDTGGKNLQKLTINFQLTWNKNYFFYEFYEKPLYSKIAHGFIFAPKPFLLTFKFAISLYLMYKTGHGRKNLLPVKAGCEIIVKMIQSVIIFTSENQVSIVQH